ncbi:hypothetical protein Sango_1540000 [Sesamum angolense]|uniref:Uncharacterized protein n=1 Tax=Sesamum angolense TaxID=2727404 RepID=A0AAE1WPS5_9LAMI|nr:hypothetical protein Sango_1540000 [Sesamum angolense]
MPKQAAMALSPLGHRASSVSRLPHTLVPVISTPSFSFPIHSIGSNLNSFSEDKMASQDSNSSLSAATSPKGESVVSPRGQCLCSPTTHQGSFRCRFHRSTAKPEWFKRSKSMPAADTAAPASDPGSPKSVEFK